MIPPHIDYVRPAGVAEAVALLGPGTRLLAGGQSLVPALKSRRTPLATLVDIGRLPALREITEDGPELVIGAAATYHDLHHHRLVREHCPVLARLGGRVADPQVRNLGTLAGSLAHADPAGDAPAIALALAARLTVRDRSGERTVPIDGLFLGPHRTTLGPCDLITAVRVPKLGREWSAWYEKFTRVSHMWAIAGACAVVRRDGDRVAAIRVGLANLAATPLRAAATEDALRSGAPIADAARLAADGTQPPTDVHASAGYRRHLARILAHRALDHAYRREVR